MPASPRLPAVRVGVATGQEYAVAGWTPSGLRHAVARGRVLRIAPGRFAPAPDPTLNPHQHADLALARRAVAAALPLRRLAVGHLAGAYIRGWPIWAPDPHPCLTSFDPRVCRVTGVHLHRGGDRSLVLQDDVVLTSAARTVVDIALEFGTESALVSGDVALRDGAVSCESLRAAVEASRGRYGSARASRLVGLLDPQAESPLESRSRWHLDCWNLRPPWSQVVLRTRSGRFLGRADHFWDEGVVGEADGRLKYAGDPDALAKEKWRQQGLEDEDLEVVRFGAADFRDFRDAARRVDRALGRARRKLAEGPRPWVAFTRDGVRIPDAGTV